MKWFVVVAVVVALVAAVWRVRRRPLLTIHGDGREEVAARARPSIHRSIGSRIHAR